MGSLIWVGGLRRILILMELVVGNLFSRTRVFQIFNGII